MPCEAKNESLDRKAQAPSNNFLTIFGTSELFDKIYENKPNSPRNSKNIYCRRANCIQKSAKKIEKIHNIFSTLIENK